MPLVVSLRAAASEPYKPRRKVKKNSAFPATLVTFPCPTQGRKAPFFLAAEEYVAAHLPLDDYLFAWILPPTVVMGRNQQMDAEIDVTFCKAEGIDIVRRKSGGGCIYADGGNIMFSLITAAGSVEPIFADYAGAVAGALTQLGVEAHVSGRNDILLADGTKVCGNAFYHLSQRNIVHGTMLYDTDYRLMCGALTPATAKLRSAGVKSVRSRTGLIREQLPIGVETLRDKLLEMLCNRTICLTDDAVREIETIEATYRTPEHLLGRSALRPATVAHSARIEGCGTLELSFVLSDAADDGTRTIEDVSLKGDFFDLGNAAETFRACFLGAAFTQAALQTIVEERSPQKQVRNLSREALEQYLSAFFSGNTE